MTTAQTAETAIIPAAEQLPDLRLQQDAKAQQEAWAPSTLRTYRAAWKTFTGWCEGEGLTARTAEERLTRVLGPTPETVGGGPVQRPDSCPDSSPRDHEAGASIQMETPRCSLLAEMRITEALIIGLSTLRNQAGAATC